MAGAALQAVCPVDGYPGAQLPARCGVEHLTAVAGAAGMRDLGDDAAHAGMAGGDDEREAAGESWIPTPRRRARCRPRAAPL